MDFEKLRRRMVEEQIIGRGIIDKSIIEAMRRVPRHTFVPEAEISRAYDDCPLPIGEGQTISQPYIVALMSEALRLTRNAHVLEIGTGSGYQTAVLAEVSAEVYSVERHAQLSQQAQGILKALNYNNIYFHIGDGTLGWPQEKSFDAIMITADSPRPLEKLFEQMKTDARMVIPLGTRENQTLMLYTKTRDRLVEERICGCVFVPLIGKYGFN